MGVCEEIRYLSCGGDDAGLNQYRASTVQGCGFFAVCCPLMFRTFNFQNFLQALTIGALTIIMGVFEARQLSANYGNQCEGKTAIETIYWFVSSLFV